MKKTDNNKKNFVMNEPGMASQLAVILRLGQ